MHHSSYPSPLGLVGNDGEGAPLVVSLTVHVHPDVSDREVLEVTRMVWGKVGGAVGVKGKAGAGGEVSVGVKRGWDGVEI